MLKRGDRLEVRNRPPKSCDPCRVRKLKCNRGSPCDTCIRRSKSCHYAANADRNPAGHREPGKETVAERLKRLENLVVVLAQDNVMVEGNVEGTLASSSSLAHSGTSLPELTTTRRRGASSTSETAVGTDPSVHGADVSSRSRSYIDPSHWSSVLEEIRQIRDELSPSSSQDQPGDNTLTPISIPERRSRTAEGLPPKEDLVFGPFGFLDLRQVLENMPPRPQCDRLVSQYFRARHAILPIIHPVKFQREYASFWDSPETTHPLWVGLLFSILSLAATLFELSGPKHSSERDMIPSAKLLSKCTEQCLVLGRYATAREHSLEVLLIHMQSSYLLSKDSDLNMWFLMGIIIRLAIRLGYHRDQAKLPPSSSYSSSSPSSSHPSSLSPFEAEMRRRVWVTIFQIDTLMSFQIGLPSMIPAEYCDADLPQNLENSDFSPESVALPDARPITDHTSILYTLAKSAIMSSFRRVISHTRSLSPASYNETVSLDAQIRAAYADNPPSLKYTPIAQSIVDSPGVIMDRTTIEILHLKSIIVLHRGYITSHRGYSLFDFSRTACLAAAETVLLRQVELHEATRPGCQLYDQRWMVSALTTSDFILAGMVLCLELTVRMQRPGNGSSMGDDMEEVERYVSLLEQCQRIWAEAAEASNEARMAGDAIESTMQRVVAWTEEARQQCNEPPPGPPENGTGDQGGLPSQEEQLPMLDDEALFIDWRILDNQFHETWGEGADLDAWLLDAVESSGPMDLL